MHRILMAGALGLGLNAFAAPASAQIAGGYNDHQRYDFAPGDASFEARLRLAARQYCGERVGRESLREYLIVRACKRDFIERARASANPAQSEQ